MKAITIVLLGLVLIGLIGCAAQAPEEPSTGQPAVENADSDIEAGVNAEWVNGTDDVGLGDMI